jgi:K+-transporting ATPase ATPase A chain
MQPSDQLALILLLVIVAFLTKPVGRYLYKVLNHNEITPLDGALKPLEKLTYKLCGIDATKEQGWKSYLFSLLIFNGVAFLFSFLLLAFQDLLPLNPEKFKSIGATLNFNTTISYLSNTCWQSFHPESTLSYFSFIIPLGVLNFLSPAVGICTLAALTRALTKSSGKALGNFWVDLVRVVYYLLLPIAVFLAIFFVATGTPQNFSAYKEIKTLENQQMQQVVQGPIASVSAIKLLGTNGANYTNVGSAHPYENPSPFTNLIQLIVLLLIPAAQTYYFGLESKNQGHGWTLFCVMALFFLVATFSCQTIESHARPEFKALGVEQSHGNLEGKEQRFSLIDSILFTVSTSTVTNGTTNSNLDSYTPLGGMVPMFNMMLGQLVWGGAGLGLCNMLIFVLITQFLSGLIVGKVPKYLGKKIEGFEIKLLISSLLIFLVLVLGLTAWATNSMWGMQSISAKNAHGFSQILYAFTSTSANNGSAFSGLNVQHPMWNVVLAIAMLLGRFVPIIIAFGLAQSFVRKKSQESLEEGTFLPISGFVYGIILVGIICLIGVLSFAPALIMGPILDQFAVVG